MFQRYTNIWYFWLSEIISIKLKSLKLPKKYIGILYFSMVGYLLFELFFHGESSFLTTMVFYSIIFLIIYFLSKKKFLQRKISFISLLILLTLFFTEFSLRFIVRYPITYNEKNGGRYISQYQRPEFISGRSDMYTLEFEPYKHRLYDSPEFDYPPETLNEFGFRGEVPKSDRKIILALGDSFTEGLGAPYDSTYPYILNQILKFNNSEKSIFNAGTAGNDPFFDFMMLKKMDKRIDVHEALFLVNTSDINEVVMRRGMERFNNGSLKYRNAPWWEPLYAISYTFRLVLHNLFNINYSLLSYKENDELNMEAVLKITELFEKGVVPWALSKNISVKVVLHPFYYELENGYFVYDSLSNKLSRVSGIHFYDAINDINSLIDAPSEIYWENDGHFNSRGYYLLANLISENCYLDDVETEK